MIEKRGFITEKDVEALIARQAPEATLSARSVLAGVSMEGVTLPALFDADEADGMLDASFLESLQADPASFRRTPPTRSAGCCGRTGLGSGRGSSSGTAAS